MFDCVAACLSVKSTGVLLAFYIPYCTTTQSINAVGLFTVGVVKFC